MLFSMCEMKFKNSYKNTKESGGWILNQGEKEEIYAQFLDEVSVSYQGQSKGCFPERFVIEGKQRMPRKIIQLGLINLVECMFSFCHGSQLKVSGLSHSTLPPFTLLCLHSALNSYSPLREILHPMSCPSILMALSALGNFLSLNFGSQTSEQASLSLSYIPAVEL